MGHLATKWSILQIPEDPSTDVPKARYMWVDSLHRGGVPEMVLIDLWETRNKDVRGHTETKQNSRLETKHQETFRTNMLAQKLHMRPCGH